MKLFVLACLYPRPMGTAESYPQPKAVKVIRVPTESAPSNVVLEQLASDLLPFLREMRNGQYTVRLKRIE